METISRLDKKLEADKRIEAMVNNAFGLLQFTLEERLNFVDKSYSLFNSTGKKTELTTQLITIINQPLESLSNMSEDTEKRFKNIIHSFIVNFFKSKKSILTSVLRTKANDLHYCIILLEDTAENRNEIFEFLLNYDSLAISNLFPIYFQFVPKEFQNSIKSGEKVNF